MLKTVKDIFEAAYGFSPDAWFRPQIGEGVFIEYVWLARLKIYPNSPAIAGVSAYVLDDETYQPKIVWRRGLLVTRADINRYLDTEHKVSPGTIDLTQDPVAEALQNLCVLSYGRKFTALDDSRLPCFELLVRSGIGKADLKFEGYNDTPGYIAFWEMLTQTVTHYHEMYDDLLSK